VRVELTVGPGHTAILGCHGKIDILSSPRRVYSTVSDGQVDVTDPYNWVRSHAVATVAGGKRVTAMVNPAWPGDPVNPALGHTTTYT